MTNQIKSMDRVAASGVIPTRTAIKSRVMDRVAANGVVPTRTCATSGNTHDNMHKNRNDINEQDEAREDRIRKLCEHACVHGWRLARPRLVLASFRQQLRGPD